MKKLKIISLLFFLICLNGLSQVSLVTDINTQPGSSFPSNFIQIGTITFFTASLEEFGSELWRTDGTDEGTYMVKDINPGLYSSSVSGIKEMNGVLFFIASDGVHGNEQS